MARLEIGDALEMRGRIVAGMVMVIMLGCVALWMGLKWFMAWMLNVLLRAKT
jgi:hypothetical protein